MAKISPLMLLPPVLFMALAATFLWGMMRDNPDELPSMLIAKPAPALPAQSLPGFPLLTGADLTTGELTVVNFWASWCPPCRAEHPQLLSMQAQGIRVAGVNFKDTAADATSYLTRYKNPFFALGFDPAGRTAIDWGVTAPPETFLIDGAGHVLFRFTGPLVGSDYKQRFLPALNAALGRPDAGN